MEEKELINLLIEGKNKNEIATEFNIPRSEIDIKIKHIYEKYQVSNRIQLAIKFCNQKKEL